mgnify:FL=1
MVAGSAGNPVRVMDGIGNPNLIARALAYFTATQPAAVDYFASPLSVPPGTSKLATCSSFLPNDVVVFDQSRTTASSRRQERTRESSSPPCRSAGVAADLGKVIRCFRPVNMWA